MADIIIDNNTYDFNYKLMQPRSLVWKDKDTGYLFFTDDAQDLHYRKTVDAGATWGAEAAIRAGTILKFAVWYDKWTKNDAGDVIHIAFIDDADDNITYNSFSTSDDTLDGEVVVFNGVSADATIDWASSNVSIVKARGGNVYVGGWIDSDGEQGFWKAVDSPATSFASRTSMADGNDVDRIMFLAGNEADSNDIWCIYQDVSDNEITLKVHDDSGNLWNESGAIESITESFNFWGFDCMDRHSDGHAILVDWNAIEVATADLAVFDITDINNWAQKTDVVTDDENWSITALLINQQNDDLYVAYTTATTVGAIKYKKSVNGGGAWGVETALSVTSDDHRAIFGGSSVGDAGGRWQPAWFNDDENDLVTNKDNSIEIVAVAVGTNIQINIADVWKDVESIQINIGDVWKDVAEIQQNIGDVWKTVF